MNHHVGEPLAVGIRAEADGGALQGGAEESVLFTAVFIFATCVSGGEQQSGKVESYPGRAEFTVPVKGEQFLSAVCTGVPRSVLLVFGIYRERVRIGSVLLVYLVEFRFRFGQLLPPSGQANGLQVFQPHLIIPEQEPGAASGLYAEGRERLRRVYLPQFVVEREVVYAAYIHLHLYIGEPYVFCPLAGAVDGQYAESRIFRHHAVYLLDAGRGGSFIMVESKAETEVPIGSGTFRGYFRPSFSRGVLQCEALLHVPGRYIIVRGQFKADGYPPFTLVQHKQGRLQLPARLHRAHIHLFVLHRADVFLLGGPVNQVFPCGILSGREWLGFGNGEPCFSGGRSDDKVGIVLHRSPGYGVQDVPAVKFGQRGKAAVEGSGNAAVVFQTGDEQGKRRFRVAAVRGLSQVVFRIFLYGGDGTEHPEVFGLVRCLRLFQ
ncbi:hypothetical protein [Bacteroides timonensis]|uniref:hypothetical protein n=1 Tax=Bacteroides timonensis TaxID=1470345 RepID=UPI001FCBFDC2|nr:hypothetical protein [Bacteroides timonensis]